MKVIGNIYVAGDSLPKMPAGSFYKPKFFDFMKEEYLACREGVGIIDMSSFSKIEIKVCCYYIQSKFRKNRLMTTHKCIIKTDYTTIYVSYK